MVEIKSTVFSRINKILMQASQSAISNPRINGLASGVIVTANGTTVPVGLTQAVSYSSSPSAFRVQGGSALLIGAFWRVRSAIIAETGGNLSGNVGNTASYGRWTVFTDASIISFRVLPSASPYRFIIDGKYVSLSGTNTSASTGTVVEVLTLDLGSRSPRSITLETQAAQGFVGVNIGPTNTIVPAIDNFPRSVLLGDSYCFGANATHLGDGFGAVIGDFLGTSHMNSGSGGTGWANNPPSYRFDERIIRGDLGFNGDPDLILLMGSINDRTRSPTDVTNNCVVGLRSARSQYPSVPIVVFGALPGATGPTTALINTNDAVASAVLAFDDPYCAFVNASPSAIAVNAVITGTGRIGAPTGTGNSDVYTDTDGIHPPTVGHSYIGQRYVKNVVSALQSMNSPA